MSAPTTILVFSQDGARLRPYLESSDRIIVEVSTLSMVMHAIATMVVNVLICDASQGQTSLAHIIKVATVVSPAMRVMLISQASQEAATRLLLQNLGYSEGIILVKPYNGIAITSHVNEALERSRLSISHWSGRGQRKFVSFELMDGEMPLLGVDPNLYEPVEVLGQGGTGTVFWARDRFLDIDVALKVVDPRLLTTEDSLAAYKDEARITMQLSHRYILRLYNFSAYNGSYYLVMELVRGKTLRDLLVEHGSFSTLTVCHILLQSANALNYAHVHNVVHKDLKLENVYLTETGEMKIIDFGAATLKDRRASEEPGIIVGTPEYMSPEQRRAEVVGPATDQYALAIMSYLMLTGCFPYPAEVTPEQLIRNDKLRPDFSLFPDALRVIFERATAYDPLNRYPSIQEFVDEVVHVCGCDALIPDKFSPIKIESASGN